MSPPWEAGDRSGALETSCKGGLGRRDEGLEVWRTWWLGVFRRDGELEGSTANDSIRGMENWLGGLDRSGTNCGKAGGLSGQKFP